MNKTLISIAASVALAAAAIADTGTTSEEAPICLQAVDVALVRPFSFVGTALGFTAYAVTSPFTAMAGEAQNSWDALVQKPAEFTLDRDLGDFR
jgi:hypothetical protein